MMEGWAVRTRGYCYDFDTGMFVKHTHMKCSDTSTACTILQTTDSNAAPQQNDVQEEGSRNLKQAK